MALPTVTGVTLMVASAGKINRSWPVGHAALDVTFVFCQTENEVAGAPTDFTEVLGSPQGSGTAAVAGSDRLSGWYLRATNGTMPDYGVPDPGDHEIYFGITVRGLVETGDPWDVGGCASNKITTASTTVTLPGGTTTNADCLVLQVCSNSTESTITQFAGPFVNGGLANITQQANQNSAAGLGGGLLLLTGEKATAGLFGSTTMGALVTSSLQGRITLALQPVPSGPTVTNPAVRSRVVQTRQSLNRTHRW